MQHIEGDAKDLATEFRAALPVMAAAFNILDLDTKPALRSRHTERKAIDMTIRWSGSLKIRDAVGNEVLIDSEPRTGMNSRLHEIGKSYGVIKFWNGSKDKPHWSTDGR
jgi:hypothetical protein